MTPPTPEPVEITDDLLDVIGTPILAFSALYLIAEQVENMGTFDGTILEGSRRWPPLARERMLRDARRAAEAIRDFAQEALDEIDAEEAATS